MDTLVEWVIWLLAIYFLVGWIFVLFGLPVLHAVGFIRHFRKTRPLAHLIITGLVQAALLFACMLVAGMLINGLMSLFLSKGWQGLFWLFALNALLGALMSKEYDDVWGIFYYLFRIPLDVTIPSVFRRIEPSLFYDRQDEILFERAKRHWVKIEGDGTVLQATSASAAARGAVIGRYIDDTSRGLSVGKPIEILTDQYKRLETRISRTPLIFHSRLLWMTALLLVAGILHALIRWESLVAKNEAEVIFLLSLNFIFGAMFAADSLVQTAGDVALGAFLLGAFIPRDSSRSFLVGGAMAYLGLSAYSLLDAQQQWDGLVSVQLSQYMEGWIFDTANSLTHGLVGVVRSVLSFSLSHIFGFSLVLWATYLVRLLMLAFSREGRHYFTGELTRPDIYGAPPSKP